MRRNYKPKMVNTTKKDARQEEEKANKCDTARQDQRDADPARCRFNYMSSMIERHRTAGLTNAFIPYVAGVSY